MDLLLARGGCARYVANAVDGDGLTALHRAAAAGKSAGGGGGGGGGGGAAAAADTTTG